MAFTLHKDQQRIVNSVMNNLDKNNLVVSPCGSGKTVIIGRIVKNLLNRNKNVIVIVPSTEVKEQMSKTLAKFGAYTEIETSIKFNNLGYSLEPMDYMIKDSVLLANITASQSFMSKPSDIKSQLHRILIFPLLKSLIILSRSSLYVVPST